MKTTIEEFQAFVTVVDTGSLTAAAQQLGQTTSGISRALSRLEHKLATTLLRRTTRKLELTEEGHVFLERARQILNAVEDAEEQMASRRERPAGRLRVDAASPFVLHVIVPLIGQFRELYPEITLELSSNDQVTDLIEQRTDLAIRIGGLRDSTLHARSLGSSALRLYAAPDYLMRCGHPESVEALSKHALLGFTQPESLNHWPLEDDGPVPNADAHTGAITPTIRASSGETLRQLAIAGNGIACLADFMTHADVTSGRLVQVLRHATRDSRQPIHAVYYRNTPLGARILAFLDFLTERMEGADTESS